MRASQRAPLACTTCTRKKLRCSKTIPCQRCVRHGLAEQCRREPVILTQRLSQDQSSSPSSARRREDPNREEQSQHRSRSPSRLDSPPCLDSPSRFRSRSRSPSRIRSPSLRSALGIGRRPYRYSSAPSRRWEEHNRSKWRQNSTLTLSESLQLPADSVGAAQRQGITPPLSTRKLTTEYSLGQPPNMSLDSPVGSFRRPTPTPTLTPSQVSTERALAFEAATSLETLAWGRFRDPTQILSCWPSASCANGSITPPALNDDYVTPERAILILEFHQTHVAWIHNVVYMPLFIRECERAQAWSRDAPRDIAWHGLYYAIICSGLYYMTPKQHARLGFTDGYAVCKQLYHKTIEAISKSNFMVIHSVYALQAICVILTCAHALGDVHRIIVLLASANSVAQSLLLHRIDATPPKSMSFAELIELENRKRVWCFLCIQDWYLIASKRSYFISPRHSKTPLPANCIEDDLSIFFDGQIAEQSLSVPTQSTYMIYLYKFTDLFRRLHDKLCILEESQGTVSDLYDEVLAADSEIESLIRNLPSWTCSKTPIDPNWPPYVLWQRKMFPILYWHQRLLIHRNFFCRSFQDKRFFYSRAICLEVSRNIQKAYYESAGDGSVHPWTLPSFVISSCIITTLDVLFSNPESHTGDTDHELMHNCLDLLRNLPCPNSIVERGIRVINHLLKQEAAGSYQSLDFKEIAQLTRILDLTVHDRGPPPEGRAGSNAVGDPVSMRQSSNMAIDLSSHTAGEDISRQAFDTMIDLDSQQHFGTYLGQSYSDPFLQSFTW